MKKEQILAEREINKKASKRSKPEKENGQSRKETPSDDHWHMTREGSQPRSEQKCILVAIPYIIDGNTKSRQINNCPR